MPDDFLIARNPEEGSALPYLVRVPLGPRGVVLKTKDTWPGATKLYCHRADGWPDDPDIVQALPVRSVSKRGAAIDLVLERGRQGRSQFVVTWARGREMIFWQSRQTAKQARPNVALPTARAHGVTLDIVVDSGEKYAWKFSHQQASIDKRRLPIGDYAVFDNEQLIAVVERKSVADLTSSLMNGKLNYAFAGMAQEFRAAVVVEAPYSAVFKHEHARGATVAEAVAEAQVRFPSVPIVFCDNRQLAQEWTYRWLGAALHEHRQRAATDVVVDALPAGPAASPKQIREWAVMRGLDVSPKGRIPKVVREAWDARNG
ncbi:ERCC4 domain-containing protein [Gordonia sp. (in: high G+C Gram-positive bacteria)]|uniref:ERCC4 domain-containing protein n=1 Tax=Gordonia sp. (in: high G+C Gram-positive bacteria) TaxID=84139 RepID=UPI003F9E2A39